VEGAIGDLWTRLSPNRGRLSTGERHDHGPAGEDSEADACALVASTMPRGCAAAHERGLEVGLTSDFHVGTPRKSVDRQMAASFLAATRARLSRA
jgi:hypothetical protein